MAASVALATTAVHAQLFIDTGSSVYTAPTPDSQTLKLTSLSGNTVQFGAASPEIVGSSLYLGSFDMTIQRTTTTFTSGGGSGVATPTIASPFNLAMDFIAATGTVVPDSVIQGFNFSYSLTGTGNMRTLTLVATGPTTAQFTYNDIVYTYGFSFAHEFTPTSSLTDMYIGTSTSYTAPTGVTPMAFSWTSTYDVSLSQAQTLSIPDLYLVMNITPPVPAFNPVPEPSTYALAGVAALFGIIGFRRFRSAKAAQMAA